MTEYRSISAADDVSAEILTAAEGIFDGWYADIPRIDWEDFLDRLDGIPLEDGTKLDLGDSMVSPAILAIKKHVRAYSKL